MVKDTTKNLVHLNRAAKRFLNLDEEIQDIWEMEIEPYLEEYFYDQPNRVEEFSWDKIKGKLYS
jgi:hypothetical protein